MVSTHNRWSGLGYRAGLVGGIGIGIVLALLVIFPLLGSALDKLSADISSIAGIDEQKAREMITARLDPVMRASTVLELLAFFLLVAALIAEIYSRRKKT